MLKWSLLKNHENQIPPKAAFRSTIKKQNRS